LGGVARCARHTPSAWPGTDVCVEVFSTGVAGAVSPPITGISCIPRAGAWTGGHKRGRVGHAGLFGARATDVAYGTIAELLRQASVEMQTHKTEEHGHFLHPRTVALGVVSPIDGEEWMPVFYPGYTKER
jgi:hypothetical protein